MVRRSFNRPAARATLGLAISLLAPIIARAESAAPTYARDVAPILYHRCAACHRPGEVAPMSLLTYEETRPWVKSIRKVVAAREMPPWRINPAHGKFRNDLSLGEDEIAAITRWADAGAPEGDPAAAPAPPTFPDGWQLGEPDHVIELEEVVVPAEGDDLFPTLRVQLNLPEDRWVRAMEFRPGDKRVVHHILAVLGDFGMSSGGGGQEGIREAMAKAATAEAPEIFSVWVAGAQATVYPEGMGRLLKKNQVFSINTHYHPNGKAATDRTRIGLYFGQGDLKKRISTCFGVNTGFLIPPRNPEYKVSAFHIFDQDSRIVSFMPHMHVRGKYMRYDLVAPDGARRTLLDVPKYDYNWQWIYYPEEPIAVPAGSRVEALGAYDNSEANPNNPDPAATIPYRDATVMEMFVAFMEFVVDEGVAPAPPPPQERIRRLLAAHPAEEGFEGRLFFSPFGLHVPREGDGMVYLVAGNVMFTSTLRDVKWEGDSFTAQTSSPTPTGGGVSTTITGKVGADGALAGAFVIGEEEEKADPGSKAMRVDFKGTRPGAALAASADKKI